MRQRRVMGVKWRGTRRQFRWNWTGFMTYIRSTTKVICSHTCLQSITPYKIKKVLGPNIKILGYWLLYEEDHARVMYSLHFLNLYHKERVTFWRGIISFNYKNWEDKQSPMRIYQKCFSNITNTLPRTYFFLLLLSIWISHLEKLNTALNIDEHYSTEYWNRKGVKGFLFCKCVRTLFPTSKCVLVNIWY